MPELPSVPVDRPVRRFRAGHLKTSRLVQFLAVSGRRRRFRVINCAQTPDIIPKLLSNQYYIKNQKLGVANQPEIVLKVRHS